MSRRALGRAGRLAGLLPLVGLACAEPASQPLAGSPSDGLVFVSRSDGNADLHRVRLADGARRPLVETGDRDELWPLWNDAAGRLVFQSRKHGSRADRLRILDPVTGRSHVLPGPQRRNEQWAAWSPDGSALAYAFLERAGARSGSGVGVFETAAGKVVALAASSPPIRFYRPEFAPDGRRLVAQRTRGSDSTLWILEPGQAPRALSGDARWYEEKARFSRDGRWVIYTRRTRPQAPGELVRIPVEGGEVEPLARNPNADDHSGRISPTRDEVAFISDRDGNPEAYRVSLDGGEPVRLTHTPDREERAPRWSPDGEWIAFTTFRAGADTDPEQRDARVVVLDRDGAVRAEFPGTMPDWMPAW